MDVAMQYVSIEKILYENLGAKITLTLIDSHKGEFYAKIICHNVIHYGYVSGEDERDICAIFLLDLEIKKVSQAVIAEKLLGQIPSKDVAEFLWLYADSGETTIEIIFESVDIQKPE